MGKEVGSFTRGRFFLFLLLVVLVMAIAGCETSKGVAMDSKTGWQMAQQGAKQGVSDLLQAIKTTDEWIKTNLW
jgi:predicted small secreted protein